MGSIWSLLKAAVAVWRGDEKVLAIYLSSAFLLLLAATFVFRVQVRRDYLQRGRLTPISVFMETSIFFLLGGFPYVYGIQDWPEVKVGLIQEILGWIILMAGLLVIAIGMGQLGLRSIFGQGSKNFKQNGFYSFSRNPQILGCWMYVIGFSVLWPSWYTLGWACLFVSIAHMMVLTEEEYLKKLFGDEFLAYQKFVPRYIGFLGTRKRKGQV
jgi:protein-S-isoprenylcysteine O-methyltransferase Ste14